MQTIKL